MLSIKATKVRSDFAFLAVNLKMDDALTMIWRFPDQSCWITWQGVATGLREDGPYVLWTGIGADEEEVLFPPVAPLRYHLLQVSREGRNIFEARGKVKQDLSPVFSAFNSALEARDKRQRSPSHDGRDVSVVLAHQQDVAAGFNMSMSDLAPGIRIPQFIAEDERWLYPHLWQEASQELVKHIQKKLLSLSCTFRSNAMEARYNLDLKILEELLVTQRTTKEQWAVLYGHHFRVLGYLLTTCQLGKGVATADLFSVNALKNWRTGRIDLASLWQTARADTKETTSEVVETPPVQKLISDIKTQLSAELRQQQPQVIHVATPPPRESISARSPQAHDEPNNWGSNNSFRSSNSSPRRNSGKNSFFHKSKKRRQ